MKSYNIFFRFLSFSFIIFGSIISTLSCNDTPYMQGKRLYAANCQNCHMEDGSGLSNLIPSLQTSSHLGNTTMACILKNGIQDTIFKDSTFLVKEMPAFNRLSATEVTNIINYINHKWKKPFEESTILQIDNALSQCDN